MRYMLLVDDCDRPEPGDPRFEGALERVNSFVEECRRRGVLRAGDPLQPVSTATTVRVRDGQTLIIDGPFAEVHEQLGGYYVLDCMQRAPQHSPVRVSSRGIAVRPWFMRWTTPRRQATSRKEQQ